jgi:hypothetical protein
MIKAEYEKTAKRPPRASLKDKGKKDKGTKPQLALSTTTPRL